VLFSVYYVHLFLILLTRRERLTGSCGDSRARGLINAVHRSYRSDSSVPAEAKLREVHGREVRVANFLERRRRRRASLNINLSREDTLPVALLPLLSCRSPPLTASGSAYGAVPQ
jgi:hypothetical protein